MTALLIAASLIAASLAVLLFIAGCGNTNVVAELRRERARADKYRRHYETEVANHNATLRAIRDADLPVPLVPANQEEFIAAQVEGLDAELAELEGGA